MTGVRSRLTAVVLVVLTVVAACGTGTQDDPRVVDPAEVPFGLLESTTTTLALRPSGATVCFVSEDGMVVEVTRETEGTRPLVEVLADALVVSDGAESSDGLESLVLAESVASASVDDEGTATVELGDEAISSLDRDRQLLALAQLTCTLTAQPGVAAVRFQVGDSTVEVPREDGTLTSDPVTREDYASLIA